MRRHKDYATIWIGIGAGAAAGGIALIGAMLAVGSTEDRRITEITYAISLFVVGVVVLVGGLYVILGLLKPEHVRLPNWPKPPPLPPPPKRLRTPSQEIQDFIDTGKSLLNDVSGPSGVLAGSRAGLWQTHIEAHLSLDADANEFLDLWQKTPIPNYAYGDTDELRDWIGDRNADLENIRDALKTREERP